MSRSNGRGRKPAVTAPSDNCLHYTAIRYDEKKRKWVDLACGVIPRKEAAANGNTVLAELITIARLAAITGKTPVRILTKGMKRALLAFDAAGNLIKP